MQQAIAAMWNGRLAGVAALDHWIEAERGRFALWLPVFMGAGVLGYFFLAAEPPAWAGAALAGPAVAAALLASGLSLLRAALIALAAAAIGFFSAQIATFRALPVQLLPTKAMIVTGTVRGVELLPAGRRITLEHVTINDASPFARRLRIRLKTSDQARLETGDLIRLRAMARPPSPPAYPGAWDIQRDAFFNGLGGYGYALGPAQILDQPGPGGAARLI